MFQLNIIHSISQTIRSVDTNTKMMKRERYVADCLEKKKICHFGWSFYAMSAVAWTMTCDTHSHNTCYKIYFHYSQNVQIFAGVKRNRFGALEPTGKHKPNTHFTSLQLPFAFADFYVIFPLNPISIIIP